MLHISELYECEYHNVRNFATIFFTKIENAAKLKNATNFKPPSIRLRYEIIYQVDPLCCTVFLREQQLHTFYYNCFITFRIRVQAVNSIGVGAFSTAIKVTTRSLPPSPPSVECVSAGPNNLKLKWGDGRNPDLVQYCLEMLRESGR